MGVIYLPAALTRPLPEVEETAEILRCAQNDDCQEIKKSGDTYSRAFGTSNRLRKLNYRVPSGNGCGLSKIVTGKERRPQL